MKKTQLQSPDNPFPFKRRLRFALFALAFCAIWGSALTLPTSLVSAAPRTRTEDTLIYPSDYRDFYQFSSPQSVYAQGDFIAVLDGADLVLLNSGNVLVCKNVGFAGGTVTFSYLDTDDVDFLIAYGGDGVYYLPLDGVCTIPSKIEALRSFEGAAVAVADGFLYTKARTVKKYALTVTGNTLTAGEDPETLPLPDDYEARFESSRHFTVLLGGTLCYTSSDGKTLRVGNVDYPLTEKPEYISASGEDVYYAAYSAGAQTVYRISAAGETKLFTRALSEGGGIAVWKDTLLLCDRAGASVLKYALSGGATLAGRIGAYADDNNRLSSSAAAVAECDGTLFVADGGNNRILSYDGSYGVVDLGFAPTYLAVSHDYYLTGTPSSCRLIRRADGTLYKEISPQNGLFTHVTYSSNGRFYLLTQTVAAETTPAAFDVYVYRITETDGAPLHFAEGEGTAIALSTDLNNNVYILMEDGTVLVFDANGTEKEVSYPTFTGAVDLQVDFENNLYLLYPDNRISIFAGNQTVAEYQLLNWSNYLRTFSPRRFFISFLEKPCYVLYDGFILRTENVVRSTPVEISVPEDVVLTAPKQETRYVTAESGAIFFRFDLPSYLQTGTPTLGYEQLSSPQTYILLGESGNYYYVLKDSDAGFIRKDSAALTQCETPLASPKQAKTLVSCTLYHFPVMQTVLAVTPNTKTLQKGAEVTLLRSVTHNGVDFYALTYDFTAGEEGGEGVAYVAKALITLSANESAPVESYVYRTARKDEGDLPAIYADADAKALIRTLPERCKVKVLKTEGKMAQVEYEYQENGQTVTVCGYMETRFLKTEGSNMALIGLVVLMLMISVVVSTGFLIKRHAAHAAEEE